MMVHLRSARLARWQYRLLVWTGLLLWGSGAAWLGLHYFGQKQGDFGPEPSPFEPWMLRLHGLVLIPALMGLGTLLLVHLPRGWAYRAQRVAGLVLATILGVLVISGYLLYYVGDDDARGWIGLIHWAIGLGLPLAGLWHILNGRRLRS